MSSEVEDAPVTYPPATSRLAPSAPEKGGLDSDEASGSPFWAVEGLSPLTPEEEVDRHRLELKIDRGFYEIGSALRELRDRRLYRSTHRSFEVYCRQRFDFTHQKADYEIRAATVVDNLKVDNKLLSVLPTKESAIRDLPNFEPDEQREIYAAAVEAAGGKRPKRRHVKSIIERIKERTSFQDKIPYQVGDAFLIVAKEGEFRKYNGCWAVATDIHNYTLNVRVYNGELQLKPDNLKLVEEPNEASSVRAIAERIHKLQQCELDRGAHPILESLGRHTYLTPLEEELLAFLEKWYLEESIHL